MAKEINQVKGIQPATHIYLKEGTKPPKSARDKLDKCATSSSPTQVHNSQHTEALSTLILVSRSVLGCVHYATDIHQNMYHYNIKLHQQYYNVD